MKTTRWKSTGIIAGLGLALSASGLALAETELTVENDGMSLTAGAVSSEHILSINLRVVGPDGFVFEERIEDSLVQWAPKAELADGRYNWEATAVTVQDGAPLRQDVLSISGQSVHERAGYDRADNSKKAIADESSSIDSFNSSDEISLDVPLERLYSDKFKSVERQSGSFRVKDGWIIPTVETEEGVTDIGEKGLFQSIAGALVDFVFPSAHAGDCTSPCNIDGANDADIDMTADTDSSEGGPFRIEVELDAGNEVFNLDQFGQLSPFFAVSINAPTSSFIVSEFGNIGIGTNAPSQDVHISSTFPQIRLEDSDGSQSWYVKNSNAGLFEIGDSSAFGGALSIEPSAPGSSLHVDAQGNIGVGTGDPTADLHLAGSAPIIRMGDTFHARAFSDPAWGIQNIVNFANPFVVFDNVPTGALWIREAGVGVGTTNPAAPLHIQENDNTAEVRVEESGAGDRTMFNLINNGHPIFRLRDSSQPNVRWEFRTAGIQGTTEQFLINKIGSGSLQMRLFGNGDMEIGGTLSEMSSRAVKHAITPVDPEDILKKIENLQISEWSYDNSPENRHLGPMAEDFHSLFGLGPNETSIASRNLASVSLAATQALHAENRAKTQRISKLEAQNSALEARLDRLEAMLESSL